MNETIQHVRLTPDDVRDPQASKPKPPDWQGAGRRQEEGIAGWMSFSWPKVLLLVPPASFILCRTLRSREPEPQAKPSTLSRRFLVPVFGSWLSSVTMRRARWNLLLELSTPAS